MKVDAKKKLQKKTESYFYLTLERPRCHNKKYSVQFKTNLLINVTQNKTVFNLKVGLKNPLGALTSNNYGGTWLNYFTAILPSSTQL
ncbi:hypothetical protein BpHYR1_013281 [Brachionus plicatilis]|uniref:Uncharacterized protein n=1 Tax=Brachionus plicatilis TaxID=10195 RepID=A0A3M7SQF4_BRAPC|nr:hypothetical protein BpHYR1_013281 [Brachionus plicatilis]